MYKLFNFLLGLLLGALVGFTIAMLFAPGSGEEMRHQIQLRKEQIIQEGKQAAAERRAELHAQLEELKKGEMPVS